MRGEHLGAAVLRVSRLRRWRFILLAANLVAPAQASVTFTPLGYVSGGSVLSEAIRVSADGSVVVGLSDSATGTQAFRWTSATGMVGLGNGAAYDVSDDGLVVVGQAGGAFRWTPETGMVLLGDLPGGINYSNALGVSADGSVVVGSSNSAQGEEAIRWTEAEGMIGLGYPPGGQHYSTAISVSADGSVIVGYSDLAVGGEAFIWTAATGMQGLGDLPGGEHRSAAWDVSSDGSVVVGVAAGPQGREAFRWTATDGMVGLGHLPYGEAYSHAVGVSGDGKVVVGESASASGTQAFRWTPATGMQSIYDLLVAAGLGSAVEGWTLDLAKAVSADGHTIVGWGHNPSGNTEAWMVYIPNLLPGDANGDGYVTPADYTIWADNFGLGPGATFSQGDFNLDGFVNGADYTLWADNYTGLPDGALAVPEPSSWMLTVFALAPLLRAASRRFRSPTGSWICKRSCLVIALFGAIDVVPGVPLPIAHYEFEATPGRLANSVSADYPLTQRGSLTYTVPSDIDAPPAILGDAVRFDDGSTNEALFGHKQLLWGSQWSIVMWFRRAASENPDYLIYQGELDGFGGGNPEFSVVLTNPNQLSIFNYRTFRTSDLDLSLNIGNVADRNWHQLAITFAAPGPSTEFAGEITAYVDGQQVGYDPDVSLRLTLINSKSALLFGAVHRPSPSQRIRALDGAIADIRMFDQALSASDVANLFASVIYRPGDANGDGFVTPADYTIWADNFGLGPGATFSQGDFNLDGFVDGADYTLWADNYTGLPPGGAMAAPEPGSWLLLTAGAAMVFAWRRRRQA